MTSDFLVPATPDVSKKRSFKFPTAYTILALLFTFLGTELGFLQRILGTTSLTRDQWLICIAVSLTVVIADELIKVFLRRRHRDPAASEQPVMVPGPVLAQPTGPQK